MKLQKVLEVFEQFKLFTKKGKPIRLTSFLFLKKFIQGQKLRLEEYFRIQNENKQDIQ